MTVTSGGEGPALSARDVHVVGDLPGIIGDAATVAEMRTNITDGDVYIVKSFMSRKQLEPIRDYLANVGRSSLPNYEPIRAGAPNSHRMNAWDPRAIVSGSFHQFQFFPWNQDVFGLFSLFEPVYRLKNLLSGLREDQFIGMDPEDGVTARLAFQFYPRGTGGLNMHADPVDRHQLTVPTMLLCKKGEDFHEGGLVVVREDGSRIDVDAEMDWGDVLFFNARMAHGVENIDPDVEPNWPAFEGRWMALFAVNKVASVDDIADAVDLGES